MFTKINGVSRYVFILEFFPIFETGMKTSRYTTRAPDKEQEKKNIIFRILF